MTLVSTKQTLRARRGLADTLAAGEGFDLIEAALWIAAEEYPAVSVRRELGRVRLIAAEGARRVFDLANPFARLDGLRTYLFEELEFSGNVEQYDDPLNCYLNQVLDRKLGIPLTLSMLFIEVARAAGFEARGIGLPGHFIARATYDGRTVLVDAFHGGTVITEEDCQQLVTRTTGRPSLFRRELLEGTDERAMLVRLLLNLKHVLLERQDYTRALAAVERLLMIRPNDPGELRDRGFLRAHLGRPGEAIADLEAYLTRSPTAPDAESVRGRVSWLRKKLADPR